MHVGAMSDDAAPTLNDWVWVEAMLFQALVGRISANFRMITLRFAAGRWAVQFFLAEDNDEDREEIDDAQTYLESYLLDITDRLSPTAAAPIDFSVSVSSKDLWLEEGIQNRILFGRRERMHSG